MSSPPSTSAWWRPTPRRACESWEGHRTLSEIVLLDAPTLADERTRRLTGAVDRVIVMSYDDPISVAALAAADVPDEAWLIASQSVSASLSGRDVFRSLPRAEGAIAAATSRPSALGGAIGKAYDELAEIIAIDAT